MFARKILCAVTLALAPYTATYAQTEPDYNQTLEQLEALVAPENHPDPVALKANPKLKEYIAILSKGKKYPEGQIDNLQDQGVIFARVTMVTQKIMLSGIKNAGEVLRNPNKVDAATRSLIEENIRRFASEAEQLEILGVHCSENMVKTSIAIYEQRKNAPDYQDAFKIVKFSSAGLLFVSAMKSAFPLNLLEYRINMSKTLAEAAPTFSSVMSPAHRSRAIEGIKKIIPEVNNERVEANLAQVIQALESTPCTPLCDIEN